MQDFVRLNTLIALAVMGLVLLPTAWGSDVLPSRFVSIEDPAVIALKRPWQSPRSVLREVLRQFGPEVGIRIPIHPGTVEGTPGFLANPTGYVANYLKPLTDLCEETGTPYILDYHVITDVDQSVVDQACAFWDIVAPLYKDSNLAASEVLNEAITPTSWAEYHPLVQQICDHVRDLGFAGKLIVGSGEWARSWQGVSDDPVTGSGIVYSVHLYPGHYTNDETLSGALDELLDMGAGILVSECGFTTDTSADSWLQGTADGFRAFVSYCDEHGIAVGGWCFSQTWQPPATLSADGSLSEFGLSFQQACGVASVADTVSLEGTIEVLSDQSAQPAIALVPESGDEQVVVEKLSSGQYRYCASGLAVGTAYSVTAYIDRNGNGQLDSGESAESIDSEPLTRNAAAPSVELYGGNWTWSSAGTPFGTSNYGCESQLPALADNDCGTAWEGDEPGTNTFFGLVLHAIYKVAGVRFWSAEQATNVNHITTAYAVAYDANGNEVLRTEASAMSAPGWQRIPFETPVEARSVRIFYTETSYFAPKVFECQILLKAVPIATDDAYTVASNATLTVSAPGVLGNDTDVYDDDLVAEIGSEPSHGTLVLDRDGSFAYTPAEGYVGMDAFTYKASDGTDESAEATVAIAVTDPNAIPLVFDTTVWQGQKWADGLPRGDWFPTLSADEAVFNGTDTQWKQLHTIDTFAVGQILQFGINPSLASGGTYADRAYVGFGDQWASYSEAPSRFIGMEFGDGKLYLVDKTDSATVRTEVGSYAADCWELFTVRSTDTEICLGGSDGWSYTAAVDDLLPAAVRVVAAVKDSTDGFLLKEVTLTAVSQDETPSLTSVTISGPSSVNEGGTATYACSADYSDGSSARVTPTWSVTSAYASINPNGVLTASAVTADQAVTVTASYTESGVTRTSTRPVTIVDTPTYTLAINSGNGDGEYQEGSVVDVKAEDAPDGQQFTIWTVLPTTYTANLADATATSTTFTMPAAAVTLTATYTAKSYTVVFDMGDHGTRTGGGELVQTVAHGTAAAEPELSVGDGWAFTGWDTSFDNVTSDLVVTACYGETAEKIEVFPVVLAVASASDKSTSLPTGIGQATVGDTFVVEFWARNADGSGKWLTVGGTDLEYDTSLVDSATADLHHGDTYTTLAQGSVDDAAGTVDEFGGGVAVDFEDTELGTTHWARIGGAGFTATAGGAASFSLRTATTIQWFRKDSGGSEAVGWDNVSLGSAELVLVADPRTPDPSGDGLCNLIDYGYFLGCYGESDGTDGWLPNGPVCDYNCDDTVNLIDYGYFLGFYGRPSGEWVPPDCNRGQQRESKIEVAAVAVASASDADKLADLPTALESATVGETFVVELWARNTDGSSSWISVGGVDISYTTALADVAGMNHGGFYTNLTQGTIDDGTGLVDEFGGGVPAGTSDTEMGTTHWARLGYLAVTATAAGTASFTPSVASTAQFFRNDPFGAVDWSSVELSSASLELIAATHTVTFRPGAHGGIPSANSGDDYVVGMADGEPVPTAPAVAADESWTHVGWDWVSARRGDAPETITRDWTATALYEETVPAAPAWQADLSLDGATPGTLTFGMRADATDGWDAGVDEQYPLPVSGQACLVSSDLAGSYSTDYHALAETGEFLFLVSARDEVPAAVSWTVPNLPEGKFLSIYEVVLDGIAPTRAAATRTLVGNTARNMALTTSLEVPAGETRCYVIRYGDDLVFDLAIGRGWNLVSLPIQPNDPRVESVLADGAVRDEEGGTLRDGLRGTISSRSVWTWQGQSYASVAQMHACTAYWVHASEATVLLVAGAPVGQTSWSLLRGWNQCGVEVPCPAPADGRIVGVLWWWDARHLQYRQAETLLPGYGYWVNASADTEVTLDAR